MDIDADLGATGDEELDEVGVESFERSLAAVDDDGAAAGTGGDVSELEGDEAAADEEDTGGEFLKVQEVRCCR